MPAVPPSHLEASLKSDAPLLTQFAVNEPGNAVEDASCTWTPAPKWQTGKKHMAPYFSLAHP